jgi:hypothetical protein
MAEWRKSERDPYTYVTKKDGISAIVHGDVDSGYCIDLWPNKTFDNMETAMHTCELILDKPVETITPAEEELSSRCMWRNQVMCRFTQGV